MKVATMGIDLVKNVFSLHGVDAHGKVVLRKTVSRGELLECFAQLPCCVVGMEACSGAHYWARRLNAPGLDARILAPRFLTNETATPAHFHQGQGIAQKQAVCRAAVYPRLNTQYPCFDRESPCSLR